MLNLQVALYALTLPLPPPLQGGGEERVDVNLAFYRHGEVREERVDQCGLARFQGARFGAAVAAQVSGVRCQVSAPACRGATSQDVHISDT